MADDKTTIIIGGAILVALLILVLIVSVANGVASGIAGFLFELGMPRDMALNVYETVRWAIAGGIFIVLALIAGRILGGRTSP